MNPLSDFFTAKDGTRIPEDKAKIAKIGCFCKDVYSVKAVTANGRKITLGEKGAKLDRVDRVAGLWRVQRKFKYKIVRVRDEDMVLLNKIEHTESTNFEYWTAKLVGYNCYGPFISSDTKPDYIVARCDTDKGVRWGYGKTLEAARAFLGLKIWDENKEAIRLAVCGNQTKEKTE